MSELEAWVITICILLVMAWIPAWVYRWMLLCFVVLPLTFVLLLVIQ